MAQHPPVLVFNVFQVPHRRCIALSPIVLKHARQLQQIASSKGVRRSAASQDRPAHCKPAVARTDAINSFWKRARHCMQQAAWLRQGRGAPQGCQLPHLCYRQAVGTHLEWCALRLTACCGQHSRQVGRSNCLEQFQGGAIPQRSSCWSETVLIPGKCTGSGVAGQSSGTAVVGDTAGSGAALGQPQRGATPVRCSTQQDVGQQHNNHWANRCRCIKRGKAGKTPTTAELQTQAAALGWMRARGSLSASLLSDD